MEFMKLSSVFFRKNLLLLKYNWISVLLLYVCCIGVFVLYVRSSNKEFSITDSPYEAKDTTILRDHFPANIGDYILYSPANEFTNAIMDNLRAELQLQDERVKPFTNATDMSLVVEHSCSGNCFGILFDSNEGDANFRFSISSTATRISPQKHYFNDEEVLGLKEDDDYIRSGFLILQHMIDKSYTKLITGQDTMLQLQISALPAVELNYLDSQHLISFGTMYSILLSVLLLSTFIVPLVEEKQDGLKEFLVIATPFNFLNGVTFFLIQLFCYLVFLIIVFVVGTFCYKLNFYIFLLFMLYTISAMSYSYLISVCFNSVFHAKLGGLVLLIIPYVLTMATGGASSTISAFFFSTKAFTEGLTTFQIFSNKHNEFTISDLSVNLTDSSFKMISIYLILLFQCIFYSLLYNYLSSIFPGPGGLKKPLLYPFKTSFRKKKQRNQYMTGEPGTDAIIIQDLMKTFKTSNRNIVIADHLGMSIKNKQITVLLGHNGAGKTTTLNMIMGSEPKDSGEIKVFSERSVASYRHLIGLCPQHSVFMKYMTCAQHLQFFAQLRGMDVNEAESISERLLSDLKLDDKANEYGNNLSGGMKRRLSLGIALSGETKVIILDEPSSGLDIGSRRQLWDILLELRKKKAILVTTHHMEEAEILGDTISILSNGRLQRTGSPLELKRKCGSGYILKLCTNNNFRERETLELIQTNVPGAKILNIVPPTVLIGLPYLDKAKYSIALAELEREEKLAELGIQSISVCDSSLEDVFLNCAAELSCDEVDSKVTVQMNGTNNIPYHQFDTSISLLKQWKAVFYKKFIYLRNEWFYAFLLVCLPLLAVGLAIICMRSLLTINIETTLPLNLQHIKKGIIYLYNPEELPTAFESTLRLELEKYGNIKMEKLILHDKRNISDELLELHRQDKAYFLQNVIGAIDISSINSNNELRLFYSGNLHHSSVILLNLIDNVALKTSTNNKGGIETNYVPIRRFIKDVSPTRLEYYAIIVPIGFFFYMFLFVSLPFIEYANDFKNLQAIPRCTYWFAVLSFDLLLHFVMCCILFIAQFFFMGNALYPVADQITIVTSIFFYGLSYLPILYSLANGFRTISTITTYLLFMLIISAIVPLITSSSINAMKNSEMAILFLQFLPDFNLNHQLRVINENFLIKRRGAIAFDSLSEGTFYVYAIMVFILTLIFFLFVLEDKYRRESFCNFFSCYNCRRIQSVGAEMEEEGIQLVRQEKIEVDDIKKRNKECEYPLLVSHLFKYYSGKAAVRDLNFAVKKSECFGLLGVNGAGKTSTFQMITTNSTIHGGTITIDGYDIFKNGNLYKYRYGYCPQHDCLNNFMSAYETLKYFALLRGIPEESIDNEINVWLEHLDLLKYAHVKTKHYSGGTKRKLNAAIAMIGSPSLVLLDEPTTGVDPVSRRFLWKCIKDFQDKNKTIVLTSHSMDECEQLCNRLAIMSDGTFKCIGFIPDLKLRYGSGFTIKVKIKLDCKDSVEKVHKNLRDKFTDYECSLRENHVGMLTFYMKNKKDIIWSDIFNRMENCFVDKDCSEIVEDYSVNESTLEDIFLKFEKQYKENNLENDIE